MARGRYPGKVGSVSLSLGGDERRKLKWAEGVIHSHHPLPKIEISINSLGKVVVPKTVPICKTGMSLALFLLPFLCSTGRMSY